MSKGNLFREIAIGGGRHVAVMPFDYSGDRGVMIRLRKPAHDEPEKSTVATSIKDGEIVTRVYLSTKAAMALAEPGFALAGDGEDAP